METVPVRLSKTEREALEAVAAELSAQAGGAVSMTAAFAYMLKNLPADAVEHPHPPVAGNLTSLWGVNLEDTQVAAVDAIAQQLAERRARLLGGDAQPVRSEAIRFVIRAGAKALQDA